MKILHPTDFSKTAEKARAVARSLAERSGGALHLVHVQQRFEESQSALRPTRDQVDAYAIRRIEEERALETRRLQERLRNLSEDGDTWDLRWGHPVRELLDVAPQFDLVVMGAHGANRLDAYFLGGIAGRVVRRARTPILTVRDEAERTDVGRVLLATDFGGASRNARALLKTWREFGIDTVAVHVIDDRRRHGDAAYLEEVQETMRRNAAAADPEVESIIREGDPVTLLPQIAEEVGADAIAVGVRRHQGAIGLLLGSRADALLRSSPVPVLSVPYLAQVE